MGKAVALYLRVSTSRQAESDLSIPDQRRQLRDYCTAKGWDVVAEYVEPGASATDDRRPEFQKMIEATTDKHSPFSAILVHSYSRFFRDAISSGLYQRKLEKNGVSVISITQEFGDDANGRMLKTIIGAVDELSSAENAKHTLRGMKENARQGYWNGSKPPLGYRVVDAGMKGDKVKRKLEIDEAEAKIVRLIFERYSGAKTGLPAGVKAVTTWLNDQGYKTREGHTFSVGSVHRILSSETYAGTHWFNIKDSKTGRRKPRGEWVAMTCPAIITKATFDAVQAQLSLRQPKKVAPRLLNNSTLLSGIARCSKCGGAMMLRTGKGKMGKIYSYYTCSKSALKGKRSCKGQSIRMDHLDSLVIEQMTDRIFTPGHVSNLLAAMQKTEKKTAKAQGEKVKRLTKEFAETGKKVDRIYAAIENGVELDDGLKSRLEGHKAKQANLMQQISDAKSPSCIPKHLMKPKRLDAFCQGFKQSVLKADKRLQKGLMQIFVSEVTIDKDNGEVTMKGPNQAILAALKAKDGATSGGVRSFVQEWRPRRDSNSRPQD